MDEITEMDINPPRKIKKVEGMRIILGGIPFHEKHWWGARNAQSLAVWSPEKNWQQIAKEIHDFENSKMIPWAAVFKAELIDGQQ